MLSFAREKLFAPLRISVEKELIFKDKEEQMAFNQSASISGWAADAKDCNPQAGDWRYRQRKWQISGSCI